MSDKLRSIRCPYRSIVIATEACPSTRCTTFKPRTRNRDPIAHPEPRQLAPPEPLQTEHQHHVRVRAQARINKSRQLVRVELLTLAPQLPARRSLHCRCHVDR